MPIDRLEEVLIADLSDNGSAREAEAVIVGVHPPTNGYGPRLVLRGEADKPFLRMNSNNYLGLSLQNELLDAEDAAVHAYGTGPGAVRFISGTWGPHIDLEDRLAHFHRRDAAILFSSAYAAMIGILPMLVTPDTAVISDSLNHNCIINAIRMARPQSKHVYTHLDLTQLEAALKQAAGTAKRAIIVTDGVFSMRGDFAPLEEINALAQKYDSSFAENVLVLVDDSHGVGAFGKSGRGTEEQSFGQADILIATLGKAIGVNGGYAVASHKVISYLRKKAPTYVYSNPITPSEAAAAASALAILNSQAGRARLSHLSKMTRRFEAGLLDLGHETIPGPHPIVPLMIRNTEKTTKLVAHLKECGVLATGLGYPVVPKGDEEIRFQICADHTPADIDQALDGISTFS